MFFSWRVEYLDEIISVSIGNMSRGVGSYLDSELATDVGRVLSESCSTSCSSAIKPLLVWTLLLLASRTEESVSQFCNCESYWPVYRPSTTSSDMYGACTPTIVLTSARCGTEKPVAVSLDSIVKVSRHLFITQALSFRNLHLLGTE